MHRQYEHAEETKIEVVPVVENEGSLAALLSVRHRLKVKNRDGERLLLLFLLRVILWF